MRPAARGGANALMDPERAYLLLRDRSPNCVRALMAPDALTIPANVVDGRVLRPSRTGPVCNNVLYDRAGFSNGADAQTRRLLYRARYYDRVADT